MSKALQCLCICSPCYRLRVTYKDGVPNEEDGGVVSNKVPVALLGVELDGKTTRITHSVSTARLTTCMWVREGGRWREGEREREMKLTKTTIRTCTLCV